METSARSGEGIEELFNKTLDILIKRADKRKHKEVKKETAGAALGKTSKKNPLGKKESDCSC